MTPCPQVHHSTWHNKPRSRMHCRAMTRSVSGTHSCRCLGGNPNQEYQIIGAYAGGCREATGVNYITHKRSARAERYRTNLDDGATEPLTGLHGGAMTPSLLGVTEPLAGLHGGAMTPSMLGASSALCADRTASADDVEVSLSEMNDKAGRTS
jgi:hypothetical protein